MKEITVFTPTYNRALILPKLYNSLCKQTNKNFLWLVIDDGSEDSTSKLFEKWMKDEIIEIAYEKQENKGKMNAHNVAVKKTQTALFVCVDSDDYLLENAIENIINSKKHIIMNNIAGMIAFRKMDNKDNHEYTFKNYEMSTMSNLYKNGFSGETTIVFKTDVIKKFLFPEIEGEKFITERYIYDQIDQEYKYILLSEPLVVCKFFQYGYTKNITKIMLHNPKGYALYYNQSLNLFHLKLKNRITYTMLYIAFSKLGNQKNIYRNSNCKSFIIYSIALILSFLYRKKLIKSLN